MPPKWRLFEKMWQATTSLSIYWGCQKRSCSTWKWLLALAGPNKLHFFLDFRKGPVTWKCTVNFKLTFVSNSPLTCRYMNSDVNICDIRLLTNSYQSNAHKWIWKHKFNDVLIRWLKKCSFLIWKTHEDIRDSEVNLLAQSLCHNLRLQSKKNNFPFQPFLRVIVFDAVIIGYHINICNYLIHSNEVSQEEVSWLLLEWTEGPLVFYIMVENKSKFMNLQCLVQISDSWKQFCFGCKILVYSKYKYKIFAFPKYYMFAFCKAWINTREPASSSYFSR